LSPRILIVAVSGDNYGDTVIRVCFNALLKVALKNLSVNDYQITNAAIDETSKELIIAHDIIFFAGGGIIKYKYQSFYNRIDYITSIAEEYNIPVILSSVGVESYDENNDNCCILKNALQRTCVKSISIRDDLDSIKKYLPEIESDIPIVCDPAVWTQHVYGMGDKSEGNRKGPIGINVVRGGLFKDNEIIWDKKAEMAFLKDLIDLLGQENLDYRLFTNGCFLDDIFLNDFCATYDIPNENRAPQINDSQALVQEIESFSYLIAFRLHASIIAFSLNIPSIAMAWNDKVSFFYQIIGFPDRVLSFKDWKADVVFDRLNNLMQTNHIRLPHEDYYLSLYSYLVDCIKQYCSDCTHPPSSMQVSSYQQIVEMLRADKESLSTYNRFDINKKILESERHYRARMKEIAKRDNQLSKLNKRVTDYEESLNAYKEQEFVFKMRISELERINNDKDARIITMNAQIDKLNQIFILRCMNFMKRISRSVKRRISRLFRIKKH